MRTLSHSLVALALMSGATLAAQGGSATYELVWRTTWSAQTHPVSFPGNPHFSGLIGGTHEATTEFWAPGALASPGIENMAELGSTSTLREEVNQAITAGGADQVLQFNGLGTSPSQRTVRFTVTAEFPHMTLVSMLAPSPDWFIGTHGLDLRPGGQWVDNLVVPLHVYDSGTDSGVSYTSPNRNTQPPEPIACVDTASGPFQGKPDPVGSYTIRRVASTSVYGCGINPAGSMEVVSGVPLLGQTVTLSVDDPAGTLSTPAATAFFFAGAPDAAFPCGTQVPGLGLSAPGAAGEFLVAGSLITLPGPTFGGSPVNLPVAVPNVAALIGGMVFIQGAMADGAAAGLTDAVEMAIGQ